MGWICVLAWPPPLWDMLCRCVCEYIHWNTEQDNKQSVTPLSSWNSFYEFKISTTLPQFSSKAKFRLILSLPISELCLFEVCSPPASFLQNLIFSFLSRWSITVIFQLHPTMSSDNCLSWITMASRSPDASRTTISCLQIAGGGCLNLCPPPRSPVRAMLRHHCHHLIDLWH